MQLLIYNYEKYKIQIKYGFGTIKVNPEELSECNRLNINQTLFVWFNYDNVWYKTPITSLLEFKTILDKTYCQEQFLESLIKYI